MPAGRRSAALLYVAAAGTLVLDQVTKAVVERTLAGRPPIRLIPGVLSLTYTTNSGGAFGLGRSAPWVFVGATIVVSAVIVAVSLRRMRLGTGVSLGLILGGALGNLTDRVVNGSGLRGGVTDFIDLHVWPIFNLADAAIVIGAIWLGLASVDRPEPEAAADRSTSSREGPEPPAAPDAGR